MDTKELVIKKENIFETFFLAWISFLATFKICFKHILIPIIGQLFGILMISLAPVLEYREMIDVTQTPDGWLYITLSILGTAIFIYFLWRFFVTLGGINLLARDIYDDRAIANLSFYISDILRKKGGFIRFLIGYSFITGVFVLITAGILYLEQKIIVYNFLTNFAHLLILLGLTTTVLTYLLFSNIALQGYTFNRILGFSRTIIRIKKFIKEHLLQLILLSLITVCFSNIISYLVQAIITFLIINPFDLTTENSLGAAIRFTGGVIINGFVVAFLQFVYARFYLVSEQNSTRLF